MKQGFPKVTALAAAAMMLGASAAQAVTIIPANQLLTGIQQELRKDKRFITPALTDVRPKSFRIVSVKIDGGTPRPKPYWLQESAVPYVNCTSEDASVDISVTGTDRSEVSLSETQSSTGSVSVEVGGEFGGVGASVAASFSQTVETGRTTTQGHEFSQTQSLGKTLPPRSGVWAVPTSSRYYYTDVPYEVEVEVTSVEEFMQLTHTWIPYPVGGEKPRFTVKGRVTATIPDGKIGMGLDPIPANKLAEWCDAGRQDGASARMAGSAQMQGKPTQGKAGQSAKPFVGMVPPDKRRTLPQPTFQGNTPTPGQ